MDRKKIIKGIQCRLELKCNECPYTSDDDVCDDCDSLFRDVLELLKEQEAVVRTCRKGIDGFSIIWTCGACGSDLHPNNAKAKFCSNCGRVVKWNG